MFLPASLILAIGCALLRQHVATEIAAASGPQVGQVTPLVEPLRPLPARGCPTPDAGGAASAVRSLDASVLAVLVDGCRRSPTLQRLAGAIGGTDGVVYIQASPCPFRGLRGCLLHLIHDTGNARYLWIRVSPNDDSGELVATIAHELQHALEVLEHGWIRSRWDLLDFYRSFESRAYDSTPPASPIRSYETTAAIDTAAAVRSELALPAVVPANNDRH